MITQTLAGTKTAGDSPNCVRLTPQLRKAAGPLGASERDSGGQKETESIVIVTKVRIENTNE